MANNKKVKYEKKYKCPYCNDKFIRNKLEDHIAKNHTDFIPQGYTPARIAFNAINNKNTSYCIMCHKETAWNETKKRYERLCGSKKCHDAYVKLCEERLQNTYGKSKLDMMNDPKFQDKMLKGRSISGKYRFTNGEYIDYVGSYELHFLEFMDKGLNVEPVDIQAPGPTIEYYYNGKKHFWITDFMYIPYNLVLDIKDGGDNPNTRDMPEYRAKQIAKEKAITQQGKYNYLRLTDNKFDQLLEVMIDLKEDLISSDAVDIYAVPTRSRINEMVDFSANAGDEFFVNNAIRQTLFNPIAYTDDSFPGLEKIFSNMTKDDVMKNIVYVDSALKEATNRVEYYTQFMKGIRVPYPHTMECEAFAANHITVVQMQEMRNQIADIRKLLYDFIDSKCDNATTFFDYMYSERYI